MVPVELVALVINERSDEQVIYLRESGGERQFPIVIGMFEAFAIDRILKGKPCERPLTHDLLGNVVTELGATVERVIIDGLRGETYFAKIVLAQGGSEHLVDARPSDAITVALKAEAPLFCAPDVLDQAVPGA